jgi:hypothetical protein
MALRAARVLIVLAAAMELCSCATPGAAGVSQARDQRRYAVAASGLEFESPGDGCATSFCWIQEGDATCPEDTASADAAKSACITRLSAVGDRPPPALAKSRFEACMAASGWTRAVRDDMCFGAIDAPAADDAFVALASPGLRCPGGRHSLRKADQRRPGDPVSTTGATVGRRTAPAVSG